MTSVELARAITNNEIPALLFLYGEESYLIEKSLRRLLDAVLPVVADRDFNFDALSAKEVRAEIILDRARTFPVFAARRLVLVKDAQLLSAENMDALTPYLQDPSPETVLVFVGDKADGRRKFFQDFKKSGHLVEFKKLYDNQIPAFVRDQARLAGYSFTEDSLGLFCRRVGNNLQEIHGELTKLFAYLGKRSLVEISDVAAIVSDTRVDSVFELTDALGYQKRQEALRLLSRIIGEGSAPLQILSMIVRHFRQLWKIHEMLAMNVSEKDIPRQVGLNPYFLKGLKAQAGRFTSHRYRDLFERFLEADLALKSSGAHPEAILDTLVVEITRNDSF